MKLWISCAAGPAHETWGTIAVIAETRDEAIAKARQRLEAMNVGQNAEAARYRQALLDNLGSMMESALGDVFIDLDPFTVNRFA